MNKNKDLNMKKQEQEEWHNPERFPKSSIPKGWRFLTKKEMAVCESIDRKCQIKYRDSDNYLFMDGDMEPDKAWTYFVCVEDDPKPEPESAQLPDTGSRTEFATGAVRGLDPKGEAGKLKHQLQLLPPAFLEEVSKALSCGADKYGVWNWTETDVEMMTYMGAILRHYVALIRGEDFDNGPKGSMAHHLGCIGANCAIILDAIECGTLVDNRPKRRAKSK